MRRIIELDALRGLAALTIVAYHLCGSYLPWGWMAVDLFFVLSGYLITSIMLRNAGSPNFLGAFYIRRGLRIWPIYYLCVVGLFLLSFLIPAAMDRSDSGWFFTFTQFAWHYWGDERYRGSGPLYHTWTLAIEEQFYLIWPALVLIFGRARVVPLALAVAGVAVVARSSGVLEKILVTSCDGFAMGGLLAAVLASPRLDPARLRAAFRGLGLAALAYAAWASWQTRWGALPMPGPAPARLGPSMLVVNACLAAVVGLVATHAGRPALAPLRLRWLCYLGLISYGLYLYHFPIMAFAMIGYERFKPGVPWGVVAAAVAAISLAVSMASWRFIERPLLGLKDRFDYRRDPREVVAEAVDSAPVAPPRAAATPT